MPRAGEGKRRLLGRTGGIGIPVQDAQCSDVGLAVQVADSGRAHILDLDRVSVQQEHVSSVRPCESLIAGGAESEVVRVGHEHDRGKSPRQFVHAAIVRRVVVNHNHFKRHAACVFFNRPDRRRGQLAGVPVHQND